MTEIIRPSLEELAVDAKNVLIWGNGGGGDVFQALPVARHLELFGVENVILGGVSGAWITEDGHVPDDPATVLLGAEIYDLVELTNTIRRQDQIVEVTSSTKLRGIQTAESVAVEVTGRRAVVIGLKDGVPAARRSLAAFIEAEDIGLVIAADIGSDTFFSGREANAARTAFVDYLSMGVLLGATCPKVFGLGGYGLDGELLLDDLENNIGLVAAKGGFLGALGITQRDAKELDEVTEHFSDPVGILVPRAARGEFGWRQVRTTSPWGVPVRVTPLAAVTLFFDPEVMTEEVCTLVPELAALDSVAQAEELFETRLGVVPETRLVAEAILRKVPR